MSTTIPATRKWLFAGLLSVSLVVSAQPAWAAGPTAAVSSQHLVTASEYETFLKEKLKIALPAVVQKGDFLAALADALGAKPSGDPVAFKDLPSTSSYYEDAQALYQLGILTSDTVRASDRLSAINAVQIALKAAGLKELAYTYPASKVKQSLAKLKLSTDAFGTRAAQELAAAVDTGLLPPAYYAEVKPNASASQGLSAVLIGQTLAVKGLYKHYIGYASDADIYAKLTDAYRQSDIIQAPELRKIVDAALEQSLVTGYNLKDARYDANFVDSLSLVYGHSDLTHALQLIGLLRSEGIDAKVQFEPKTSAFVYLKEWGDPGVSDLYEVRQIANGNYIEYAKEYDIAFEFASQTDKARFDKIVLAYAKKNEEAQSGLIAGSWWQPLYYSFTELSGYKAIANNKIDGGRYYAQSFSLKEKSAEVVAGFRKLDPQAVVTHYDFWADVPFYNYLNGESK
ncbi:hypothetical protein [Cohnella nanjingensis]|uniref:SLH domain-containing protein n=1 Tax=Cohnella nanjingensis TaxID=1387779 RepID=A0A7X0VGS6_9BACL|nr:hypothetical protein [Cohnella nanjingensis]MBB6672698.1 hypothetical protein [Cohnella nanjingensis]